MRHLATAAAIFSTAAFSTAVFSTAAVFATAVLATAGCDSKGPIAVPDLGSGKSDVTSHVEDLGELGFDEARTGGFTEDLQFFAYHLAVGAGAVVTIDNSHLGTAAKLDSTLFVFGPRDASGFGSEAIAFDDDSGWGRHARLRDLALGEAGEYLVVLGTANNRGRGHYRLAVSCENGDCAPPPISSCETRLADGIAACIAAQIADSDLESDETTSYGDALEICSDGEAVGPVFDAICAAPNAPAFCDLPFEEFFQSQVPPCADELEARGALCGAELSGLLAGASDGLLFVSEGDFPYDIVSEPGLGAPTAAKILALSGRDPDSTIETTDFEALFAFRGRPEEPEMDDDERESVRRHRHIRRILEGHLTSTLVVRIGEIQVRVYLVGETACGELAGLETTSIET